MNDEERIKAKAKAVAEYFDSKSKKEETKRIEENFYENLKWEQRRYEIARDVLAAMVASEANPFISKTQIDTCVQMADELISVLRKSKVTYAKL